MFGRVIELITSRQNLLLVKINKMEHLTKPGYVAFVCIISRKAQQKQAHIPLSNTINKVKDKVYYNLLNVVFGIITSLVFVRLCIFL